MTALSFLIPIALLMGLGGLAAFVWSVRNGQLDDLDGAAHRILLDDDAEFVSEVEHENDPNAS